jgi:hypothetical protein
MEASMEKKIAMSAGNEIVDQECVWFYSKF